MEYINKPSLRNRLLSFKRKPGSLLAFACVVLAAAITVGVLGFILLFVLIKGIPTLTPDLFAWEYTKDNASLMPALINTLYMTFLSLLIAVPIGVFAAVYMVEYAKRGNRFVAIVGVTAETLAGIPSIVYGLFGFLFFVTTLGWRYSMLAGACTMAMMILPLIMRTTEEALKAVPDNFREGSFGLGAGRLRTVFKIVLPSAIPGILAGIILAIGRVVGETAALIYTAGSVAQVPPTVMDSGRTLAVHMYNLYNEGMNIDKMYGTAVILLLLVILINGLSSFVAKKLAKS